MSSMPIATSSLRCQQATRAQAADRGGDGGTIARQPRRQFVEALAGMLAPGRQDCAVTRQITELLHQNRLKRFDGVLPCGAAAPDGEELAAGQITERAEGRLNAIPQPEGVECDARLL